MGMGLLNESDSSPFAELRNGASGVLGAPYEARQENTCKGNTASLRNSNDREAEHRWASVESAHKCVNVIDSIAFK